MSMLGRRHAATAPGVTVDVTNDQKCPALYAAGCNAR